MPDSVKKIAAKDPQGVIGKAYAFAEQAHRGQTRKSGEPYFNHVLATAEILRGWRMDDATVAAGLLHDTVEDTGVPLATIKTEFGDEVAFLVDGVTKLGHIKYRGAEGKAENMRKMIFAISEDLRVVFIKLADRLHNMRTLGALPPAKQKRIALETDEIYASLAYRLGMQSLSGELQDLAFPYLLPREHRWLLSTTKERFEKRLAYLAGIKPRIEALLKQQGIKPITIDFRAKRYASLYKKLLRHDMNIDKIYDLVAMRIIVETIPECYAVLGVIHEEWPPLPGRIKDYIAMPKPNAYRSLHTTVIGPEEKIMEFQIRTKEMHDENEYGVAAHWVYEQKKNGAAGAAGGNSNGSGELSGKKLAKEIEWVQQLKNWQAHLFGKKENPEEFLRSMKFDFFKDRIFAITPRGDVVDLPVGATPIDFAYHIHSEVGNAATGAKVNRAHMPLDHQLTSGDMVEIITQKGKKPSKEWLAFAKTGVAQDHIRAALKAKHGFADALTMPTHCELRVVVLDRADLIQNIATTIAANHMNILSFHAENAKGGRFPVNKIEIQSVDKQKIEKLILKIKRLKGVEEISYKLV